MGKEIEGELVELNEEGNKLVLKILSPEQYQGQTITFPLNYKDPQKGKITEILYNNGTIVKDSIRTWVFEQKFPELKSSTENKTSSPAIESISLEQNSEIIDSNQNQTFLKTFAIKIFNLIEVALEDISRALITVNKNFTNISKILEDLKNGQFK